MEQKDNYHWRAQLVKALSNRNISLLTGKKILLHTGTFKTPEEKEQWAAKATKCVMNGSSETQILNELEL